MQLLALMIGVSAGYLIVFFAIMIKLELQMRTDKLNLYEMIAGVRCLESRTVIDENIVEESLFYLKDIITVADIDLSSYKKEIEVKTKKTTPKIDGISINDLKSWRIIKTVLLQPDTITKYEEQEFSSFYIITPCDDLSAFHEVPNTSIYFNGKTYVGTKIYGDLLFISWITPNEPLFLLYNSPKLVLSLTNIRKDLEGVELKILQALTQEILDYQEKQKNFDYIVEEKLKQIDLLSKQKMLAEARAEFVQTESLEKPDTELDPNITYVNRGLLWFLGIGFFVFSVLYLSTLFARWIV